ncbi:MAG: hypothetical protein ABA06_01995 [Parcubacteria bacterium C7867-001]|nr:MAG: hypothetical protein ABA06_01995 [Parcubacteria bacterium C7867-001]
MEKPGGVMRPAFLFSIQRNPPREARRTFKLILLGVLGI